MYVDRLFSASILSFFVKVMCKELLRSKIRILKLVAQKQNLFKGFGLYDDCKTYSPTANLNQPHQTAPLTWRAFCHS